jgi:hypothetical protein
MLIRSRNPPPVRVIRGLKTLSLKVAEIRVFFV